jgi:hypothetical protein
VRELAVATVALLALTSCATEATNTPTRVAKFEPVGPSFDPIAPESAVAFLEELVIEPEHADAGYNRGLFEHWIDADGDGCDTRCEVLEDERRTDLPGPGSGWRSPYDGRMTNEESDLEIDHVVALAEAWRSGADQWSPERRREFANDVEHPETLVAVTVTSNRIKSDSDAANWRPPDLSAWCGWAEATVVVKRAWQLSVDEAEAQALASVLASC